MARNAANPIAPSAVTAATAVSTGLSAGADFLTRAFFLGAAVTSASTAAATGTSSTAGGTSFFLAVVGGLVMPTPDAALGGTGILMVDAALPPSAVLAARAGGTAILIVGEAAGFGGRLMRTVCFLDSCEPPAAGFWVVSSDIVQKFKRPRTVCRPRRSVKRLKSGSL